MGETRRRFTIRAEVTVDVADGAALRKAALTRVAETRFVADGGRSVDEIRASETDDIRADLSAALGWVTDVDAIVEAGVGAEVVGSSLSVVEGDAATTMPAETPDFAALFSVCSCERDDCEECSGFQMTPRTAGVLWAVAQLHADFAYDDVHQYGDVPVTEADGGWVAFADYPRITWGQDAVWRRQAARAFDDLAADLGAGGLPPPTCPGEEMALHLMLRSAQGAAADGWGMPPEVLALLPQHADDYDWDSVPDVLLQDDDTCICSTSSSMASRIRTRKRTSGSASATTGLKHGSVPFSTPRHATDDAGSGAEQIHAQPPVT